MTAILVTIFWMTHILLMELSSGFEYDVSTIQDLDYGNQVILRSPVRNETVISSKIIRLNPMSSVQILTQPVHPSISSVLIQVHSQRIQLLLSYEDLLRHDVADNKKVMGKNIGLIYSLKKEENHAELWVFNPNETQVTNCLVMASFFTSLEPVPGACNLEFKIEVAPYLKLTEGDVQNRLEYSHARLGSPRGLVAPTCDTSFYFISYQVYSYYLKENDFSEREFFRSLEIMSHPQNVSSRATLMEKSDAGSPKTLNIFMSYPGRGVVYTVLCFFNSRVAAYVPIASYNCDLDGGLENCGKTSGVLAMIIVSILAVVGLIVSLRGHQWFQMQICWSGAIATTLVSYLLLFKYSDLSTEERDMACILLGMAGSFLWLIVWKIFGIPILSLALSGLLLGFLMISCVLYTTLGNDDIFRSDLNYWLIVGCGTVIIPVVLSPFTVLLSVFSTSLVGSYCVIFGLDRFMGGSLAFIVINVFKRALFDEIYRASNHAPFQTKDVILMIVWLFLALMAIGLQLYTSIDRPPFPPHRLSSASTSSDRRQSNVSVPPDIPQQSRRRSRSRSKRKSVGNEESRRSGPVRASAPPTEPAQEIQPLLAASTEYNAVYQYQAI